jgi:PTS system ascorbate-specific IIC component
MQHAFNAEGLLPNTDAFAIMAIKQYSGVSAFVVTGAFVVNILLAKFTKFKYIFLTGHHALYMAVIITVVMSINGITGLPAVAAGSLLTGCAMTFLPAINQKYMRKITGGDKMAIGHFSSTGYFLAGFLGKFVGKPEDSCENIKLPKGLDFARETIVTASIMTMLMFIICVSITGPQYVYDTLKVEKNIVVYIFLQGLSFGAGVAIVFYGVNMMVAEILSAFKGIADRVVPNSIPALDCAAILTMAPNSVLVGFIAATFAGVLTSILLGVFAKVLIVPPIVQFFFVGGATGVFGNATGGKKGAILGGIIQGIFLTVLPMFFAAEISPLIKGNITMADPDFNLMAIILGKLLQLFK